MIQRPDSSICIVLRQEFLLESKEHWQLAAYLGRRNVLRCLRFFDFR
jgi:hypothetical protein